MTPAAPPPKLRRILVALDAAERSNRALEEAARLAAGLEAELVGLFIEDSDLLAAAALPATRLLPSHGPTPGLFDAALMQRALRVWSAEVRKSFEAAAARWQVRCSFQVVRGLRSEQLLSLSGESDLLTFETDRRLRGTHRASTAQQVVAQARCSVFLMQCRGYPGRPIMVVYEGTEQVLSVGRKLAEIYRVALHVLVPEARRAAAAKGALGEATGPVTIDVLSAPDAAAVAAALERLNPSIIVVQRHGQLAQSIAAVQEGSDSSLLLVD